MAFRSTSERYEYIYGNNVTKLAYEDKTKGSAQVKRQIPKKNVPAPPVEKKTDPQKEALIQKNKARLLSFDWKFTVVTAVAVLMCALGALVYVHGTVRLGNLSAQVSNMKSEKAELLSKQAALRTEIDKNINLDEIRKFAKKELHMIYPDPEHTLYYKDSASDYFRQYESINAGK